jgi:Zn-dependent peptidase ImmA (M78 family)
MSGRGALVGPGRDNDGVVERVAVKPQLLDWAADRAALSEATLRRRFPKFEEWQTGERAPTRKQLEAFARATHVPTDWLFLEKPPEEQVPIPDRRAFADTPDRRPSPDLLETIARCRERQAWYRRYARRAGQPRVDFVRRATVRTSVAAAAAGMRSALEFEIGARGPNYTRATRVLAEQAEARGVLVMVNGVVGSNTRRKLDPSEFRAFTLSDRVAPVVFVNGADNKAIQIFTLARELARLRLGETALSDVDPLSEPANDVERWCTDVALEFLVPAELLRDEFDPDAELGPALERLGRRCKVSTLVALRAVHNAGHVRLDRFEREYRNQLAQIVEAQNRRPSGGGNFYNTQPVRVSKRFARALVASALEGDTPQPDAFRMLGFRKASTLQELGRRLGPQ